MRFSSEALGRILCRQMPSNGIHGHYGREAVKPITFEDMIRSPTRNTEQNGTADSAVLAEEQLFEPDHVI
jgi:hypothetical protein